MGADQNVAVMRRAYDAFNTGDIDTLTELFDESAVWHLPGRSSMADDYQGREATLAYFGQLAQKTGGSFRAELQQLTADGEDRVVGVCTVTLPLEAIQCSARRSSVQRCQRAPAPQP